VEEVLFFLFIAGHVDSFNSDFLSSGFSTVAAYDATARNRRAMSAIGPKQTSASAVQMSAFGGKADMGACTAAVAWTMPETVVFYYMPDHGSQRGRL
jgi:hypothetical protein